MKEYRNIADLPSDLKKEIENNETFFNNVDGKSLDEQQRIACVLNDCDLEIIAGAGTGKTQTLVAKSNYLIEKKNILPSEILCLSFSTSSVEDLTQRLTYPIETRTIHALGLSIINKYNTKNVLEEYGFFEVFKHYVEDASPKQLFDLKDYCETHLANSFTKIKLHEFDSEEEKLNYLLTNTSIKFKLKGFIDLYKGKDLDISDLNNLKKTCDEDLKGTKYYYKNMAFLNVADSVFRYYQSYLSRNHLIDFNDMVNKAIKVIEKEGFDNNYKYIFVDEYQDMSYKNFQLVKAIKDKTNANLVVVGDDWQSIYGFRDSDLKLFTEFDDYFPNAIRIFIEKTYRNPQQLIDTAGNFIMRNDDQFKKSLQSDLSCENPIKIVYHSKKLEKEYNTIHNLIYNLSKNNSVLILGRHRKDIDEFLKETDFVKKGRSKNHKQIADKNGIIENVEYRTIHKAKGLEADYTIIIQVIDDMVGFPNKLYPSYFMKVIHDWDNDDKLEEERRLFYVALTRARKGVYIFTTRSRESEYIAELKEDSLNNLEIIYSDDLDTYSHLSEFNEVAKVKKSRKVKKSKVEVPLINDTDMEDRNGIEIKATQKDIGNNFMKSKEYDEAEDFYKKLITNMYYVNDYYPYRKLVEVYRKKKESGFVIKVIEAFFKSERYCNESQLSWFKLEYRNACKYTGDRFTKFEDLLNYFYEHGFKNKNKQNNPVPIAARIKIGKYGIKIISQEDFDNESNKKDLELKYKFERKYGSSKKTLEYFEQLWQQKGFAKNLTAYKRLCSLYEDVGDYKKVIEVANEYFESNAKRTRTSPDWFRKKVKKAESMLNKEHVEIKDNYKPKKSFKGNVITVSNKNHRKLLSCEVGDVVTIKKSRKPRYFEIIEINNPDNLYAEIDDEVIIKTSKENFTVIENLKESDLLIIKHKNYRGDITLKIK